MVSPLRGRTVAVSAVCALLLVVGFASQAEGKPAQERLLSVSPSRVTAGEPFVLRVGLRATAGGVAPGGGIRFHRYLKLWNGLLQGVSDEGDTNALVRAERSDGGAVSVRHRQRHPRWPSSADLEVVIRGTPLAAGEHVRVTIGDDAHPVTARRKQRKLELEAEIDADATGRYAALESPPFAVAAAEPVRLAVVAPSVATLGEPATLVVYAEDRLGNVCEEYRANVRLRWQGEAGSGAASCAVRRWAPQAVLARNECEVVFERPGLYYVRAEDPQRELNAVSNPVRVLPQAPELRLYWGEIHVHSQVSDGRGELADLYRDGYARGLDFIAVTDHGFGRAARGSLEERLQATCAAVERFHRPGRYVIIPAGETHYLPNTHVNLYFAEVDPGRMLDVASRLSDARPKRADCRTPEGRREAVGPYWQVLAGRRRGRFPLAFPHHSMWVGYPEFTNAGRQRVIEIFSTHGTSEIRDQAEIPKRLRMKDWRLADGRPDQKYSVREVLGEGHRLGFVGGSDDHSGQPAASALTAVWAPRLSRRSVMEAMHGRSCYATSANRTIIRLSGDARMGTTVGAGRLRLTGSVAPDGELKRLEVVADGRPAELQVGRGRGVFDFSWTPAGPPPEYGYIRVTLNDAEAAWSSPVWSE